MKTSQHTLATYNFKLPKINDSSITAVNLRGTDGDLRPVGMPIKIAATGASLFFTFHHSDGEMSLFHHSDGEISVYCHGNITIIGNINEQPLCSIATESDKVIIMTSQGPWTTLWDNDTASWSKLKQASDFDALSLIAYEQRQFSTTTPSRTLTGGYTRWSGRLTNEDIATLTSDVGTAYQSVCKSAQHQGYYTRPVIARYRILDSRERQLYVSTPVVVAHSSGLQRMDDLSTTVSVQSSTYCDMAGIEVAVNAFRLGLRSHFSASQSPEDAVSIEIQACHLPRYLDLDSDIEVRLVESSATQGTLLISIPSRHDAHLLLQYLLDKIDFLAMPVARLAIQSFANDLSSGTPHLLQNLQPVETDVSDIKLYNLLTTKQSKRNNDLDELSHPHSFYAHSASVAGDIVAWGDPVPIRAKPISITQLTSATGASAWKASISVEIDAEEATGEREIITWNGEDDNYAPLQLSPMLVYPHPRARLMTISLYHNGTFKQQTFALSPTPCGRFSCFVTDDFTPISLPEISGEYSTIPTQSAPPRRNGTIAVSNVGDALSLISAKQVSQGGINAITPASRTSSGWNFSRSRIYAFTATGIYTIDIDSKSRITSSRLLDSRQVIDNRAVTSTNDEVFAVASGDLIKITGARAKTIAHNCSISQLS